MLLLSDDELAEPYAADVVHHRPDPKLLLGTCHDRARRLTRAVAFRRRLRTVARGGQAVVAEEAGLAVDVEMAVLLQSGRVLYAVLAPGEAHVVVGLGCTTKGHEALVAPEQPGLHRDPLRLACLVVDPDLGDLAELGPLVIEGGAAHPCLGLLDLHHSELLVS